VILLESQAWSAVRSEHGMLSLELPMQNQFELFSQRILF
jgi:hypothetical protein